MAIVTSHPQARALRTDPVKTVSDILRDPYADCLSPIRTAGGGGGGNYASAGQDGGTMIAYHASAFDYTRGQDTSNDLVPSPPAPAESSTPLVVLAPTDYPAEFMGLPTPAPIPQRSYALLLEELAYLTQHLGLDDTQPVDEQMMALREWIESHHADIFP